jgi:membrane associated rhomboid family serine protease
VGDASERLRSPTRVGQTGLLVRIDGAVAAFVLWDLLPYWARARWGADVEGVREKDVAAFIEVLASPVALWAAVENERIPEALRSTARERLAGLGLGEATLLELRRHFVSLMDRSRKRLIVLMSMGGRANAEVDRVDILGEVVALRGLQHDVSSERGLARVFRAMFRAQSPWVLYVIGAVFVVTFVAMGLMDESGAKELRRALALYPDFERPWTLLTYPWLHLDVAHLVLNTIALGLVAHVLERVLGHLRFFLVFVGFAVGAGIISVVVRVATDVAFWTVGASGALAGLAGLSLFLGMWFSSRYGRIPIHYTGGTLAGGLILASNMIIAATSGGAGADHGAHLGGLALGVGAGFMLRTSLGLRADRAFGMRRPAMVLRSS